MPLCGTKRSSTPDQRQKEKHREPEKARRLAARAAHLAGEAAAGHGGRPRRAAAGAAVALVGAADRVGGAGAAGGLATFSVAGAIHAAANGRSGGGVAGAVPVLESAVVVGAVAHRALAHRRAHVARTLPVERRRVCPEIVGTSPPFGNLGVQAWVSVLQNCVAPQSPSAWQPGEPQVPLLSWRCRCGKRSQRWRRPHEPSPFLNPHSLSVGSHDRALAHDHAHCRVAGAVERRGVAADGWAPGWRWAAWACTSASRCCRTASSCRSRRR